MGYEAEVVSTDTGTPVEETVVTPTEEVETEAVAEVETTETESTPSEDNLVELPDGRKLPPKEAEAEYRNLYSEFTRKSQELATFKKGTSEPTINKHAEKEEWIPQTWEEVLERSKQALREDMLNEQKAEQERLTQNEQIVTSQLTELKKENPKLDENQLFNHALKYGFQDLKVAYSNMKDMQSTVKKATELVTKNLQKRSAEPISGASQGGDTFDGDVYDPSARNMSAVDYLRSLK